MPGLDKSNCVRARRRDCLATPWRGSPRTWWGWRPLPAEPRRSVVPLPLLPSGPGGVDGLPTRGTDRGHHESVRSKAGYTPAAMNWRRGRDSNPRYGYKPYTHFPGVLLQPLGHLSAKPVGLPRLRQPDRPDSGPDRPAAGKKAAKGSGSTATRPQPSASVCAGACVSRNVNDNPSW